MEYNFDNITWDEYFMGVALLSARRSKDPNTKVGACIVNTENKIVGIGYNGMPVGCDDDKLSWNREANDELDTKYPYVCHAELNAILNSNQMSLKNCTAYVTLFPCNECAKAIIQSGIKKIVYMSDKYRGTKMNIAAKTLFLHANVLCEEYTHQNTEIKLSL